MLKRPRQVTLIKILRFNFLTLFTTYVYRCESFSVVDIIIEKEEEIFGQKILMMVTTISFLVKGFTVLRLSINQFVPVWAETVKNYPIRKLELLRSQNRYIGHQCGILKKVFALEVVEDGQKSLFFKYFSFIFFFGKT